MAGKRQATSDLNHDNWDREEEPEERGTFRTAAEDELKHRVIKKAKRKISPGAGDDGAGNSSGTKSVFSGFSGFGKPATSTASSSPFSFLSKINASANPAALSGSTTVTSTSGTVGSSATTTDGKSAFSLGSGSAVSTITSSEVTKTSFTNFSFGNTTPAMKTPTTTSSETSKQSHNSEYYKKLSSLNQAVSEWIKTHVDKNSVCILSPIFEDYKKYLKEIEEEKNNEEVKSSKEMKSTDVAGKPTQSSTTSTGMGSFKFTTNNASNANVTAPTSTTTDVTPKTNGFSFGLKKPEDVTAQSVAPSTFNFNIKPSTAETSTIVATSTSSHTTPSTGFSFGNFSSNTNQSPTPPKPFSFAPGATPFSFGCINPPPTTAATSSVADDEDKDEEPPKNEFKQVVEDDAIYSKKCKVFVKKDGNFVDKGVGTLYLKPVEASGKTQLLVRADTNLGNILVNLILSSAIPTQRMGKNNVMMVCLPTPDVEKPTSMLLRVKTAEEADELLENIDKYKK